MGTFTLPGWALPHVGGAGHPVSHGLNLALPLQHPELLPLLALKILALQRHTRRALDELNFVHFARFVPSWDGRALMVTTEFDGPLEPYVMDFAIAIGDVFTLLLSNVHPDADPPPLPVKNHPDAFYRFVMHWNRVPVGPRPLDMSTGALLPASFDYPLYSAYPAQTVVDITGPRKTLPSPVVDRPDATIDVADVQGNLLRGYRPWRSSHFFVTVSDAALARPWLAALANGAVAGVPAISDASDWAVKPALALNVGFTFDGMSVLWQRAQDLALFPAAFRDGPAARAAANGDSGNSAPATWLFGAPGGAAVHAMLSLYAVADTAAAAFDAALPVLAAALAANGLALLRRHDADAIVRGGAVQHGEIYFGYKDGAAEPRIAGLCSRGDDMQPASSPGEFLLGANYVDIYGGPSLGALPADIASNGAFCAVRLLEQHVDKFEQVLTDAQAGGADPELVAAKLMGRWRDDGSPLSLRPLATDPPVGMRNDFDYSPSYEYPGTVEDHFGRRCPVGAHIRRCNPRSARVAGVRHARRLIRRGLPSQWTDASGSVRQGLFGMFLCGSIERQFEFIQQQWIDGDLAAAAIRGTQDPIAGSGSLGGRVNLPGAAPGDGDLDIVVPRLVDTRGSVYLFVPGLAAIRQLALAPVVPAVPPVVPAPPVLPPPVLPALQFIDWAAVQAALTAAFGDLSVLEQRLRDTLFPAGVDSPLQPPPVPAFASGFDPARFDPTDPRFLADPYPTFAQFRQHRPVHWVPQHRAFSVFGRSEVLELCNQPHRFRQKPQGTALVGLLTMDGAEHAAARAALNTGFTNALSNVDTIAAEEIDAAIADLTGRVHFELVSRFAARVPRAVFFRLLGVDQATADELDALARTVMAHADTTLNAVEQFVGTQAGLELTLKLGQLLLKALQTAVVEGFLFNVNAYKGPLLGQIALRMKWLAPPPPLLSLPPGAPLTILQGVMTALQFVLAGYLSSEFLLATASRNFLLPATPQRAVRPWDELRADRTPPRLERALDEARRFDSPLGVIERYAAADDVIGGVAVKKGDLLLGLIGSANRDAAAAGASAEAFDMNRQPNDHRAFGDGAHRCIGAPLQARVVPRAMRALIDAVPQLRLQSPNAVPPWLPNVYFRSFTALAVTTCP